MKAMSTSICSVLLFFTSAFADVTLPSIFSDNMILQQGKPIKIWGWASPEENVTVTLAGESKTVVADKSGNWNVKFNPLKASFDIIQFVVKGKNTITLKNVLVGEVWLCSGQSNMEWPVALAKNGKQAMAAAKYPYLRLFDVPHNIATRPVKSVESTWQICSPDTVGNFSAIGYFFGVDLFEDLKVPVGLIAAKWGGTCIETWTPAEYLRRIPSMVRHVDIAEKMQIDESSVEKYKHELNAAIKEFAAVIKKAENSKEAKKNSSPSLDEAQWQKLMLPGTWESQGLDYDGYVWLRKRIQIPQAWAGKDIVLNLGPIDEIDVTWFNGVEVGRSGNVYPTDTAYWNRPRHYRVPGKLVHAGENVIAIRVADLLCEGGLWSRPANEMYCCPADDDSNRLTLAGEWKMLPAGRLPEMPTDPRNPNVCAALYNGMIAPIAGFTMRGIIWYQGENNASQAYLYRELMPLLINAWRDKWHDTKLVFIQTQLANYMQRQPQPCESYWPELREAQLLTSQKMPYCGMAVTIDVGEADDIHPRNKQDVGTRLAAIAKKLAYKQNIPYQGPVYKKMRIQGGKVILTFDCTFKGLSAKGGNLKGFAIAGDNKKFVWADAKIQGNNVIVWSKDVPSPVAVRYGWADNPDCNLYNNAGFPASPFRTDDWPGLSVNNR